MPKGIELFRDHFAAHTDKYVLIGGSACEIALNEATLEFRATKDLDLVLTVASLDSDFSKRFWDFVTAGEYQHEKVGFKDATQCYRFHKPAKADYPAMLELFARKADFFQPPEGRVIGRVTADQDASSLSAILMDDDYYALVEAGRRVVDSVSCLNAESLIPLKAKAFIDLSARKAEGKEVKSDDIKKHKNDVFRLSVLLAEATRVLTRASVKTDLTAFLQLMMANPPDLRLLGLGATPASAVIERLAKIYQL